MRVAIDENIPYAQALLGNHCTLIPLAGRHLSARQLLDVDALLVRSVTQVNAGLLSGTPVRFVGSATIGTDHLDIDFLNQSGIRWCNAPGCNAQAVAEYVAAALCSLSAAHALQWQGRSALVVGYGNVGRRVAHILSRLGLVVRIADPLVHDTAPFEQVELADALASADLISLHVPLTRTGFAPTYHLFDELRLRMLKPGAVLINSARGAVIDNSALRDWLLQGPPLYTVLDVWENEPQPDPALVAMVDIATPHIAGYSLDGKYQGTLAVTQQLLEYFDLRGGEQSALLTAPVISRVLLETGHLPLAQLQRLIPLIYDIEIDNRFLKRAVRMPDCGHSFDSWRRDYRLRREFSALTLEGGDNWLLAMGFGHA